MKNEFGKNGILVSETEKLAAVIKEINGKATSWTVCDEELKALLEKAEKDLLGRGFTRRELNGVVVRITSAGPSSSAYKYAVMGSTFSARMSPKGWRVLSFEKESIYPKQPARFSYEVSKDKHELLVARVLKAANANLIVKEAA